MKIFIDDIRNPITGSLREWVVVRTYQDFTNLLHELKTKR